MKLSILAVGFLAGAALAQAQVPGLINYQGRLTTPSGAPASGTRNFSLSIFDAETGGTMLYTEAVGPVTLDATGVYSFQFGSAGTSNTQVVETLATTDGAASSFQKVLANTGVVPGSLSITDGTYTWSQSAGSSNEDDFGVAFSSSLRRVTVSYFSAPPAAGKPITATYRYGTGGISGAISAGSQHWMALSIDGVAQTGRQRVLAVPFAMQAGHAVTAVEAERVKGKSKLWRPESYRASHKASYVTNATYSNSTVHFPMSYPYRENPDGLANDYVGGRTRIPSTLEKLNGFRISAKLGRGSGRYATLWVEVIKYNPLDRSDQTSVISVYKSAEGAQGDPASAVINVDVSKDLDILIDSKYVYEINFSIDSPGTWGSPAPASEVTDLSLSVVD